MLILSETYSGSIFRPERNLVRWTMRWGVVLVDLREKNSLMKNIRYYMLQDQMGLGPSKYCEQGHNLPGYESRVLLLMNYLPQEKICTYPLCLILKGPFVRPQWREKGNELSLRGVQLRKIDAPRTWVTSPFGDMVCMQVREHARLVNNIRFALFKESIGLGPKRYCMVYRDVMGFYAQIGLVMTLLYIIKCFCILTPIFLFLDVSHGNYCK